MLVRRRYANATSASASLRLLAIVISMLVGAPAHADEFRHLSLGAAVYKLKKRGLDILYSSNLIQPSMRVLDEPIATDTRGILEEILKPHGLRVQPGPNGLLMLVRETRPSRARSELAGTPHQAPTGMDVRREEIVVSASQYELVRELQLPISLSAADLTSLPDLGDDPLRAASRLPGMAGSEFSARLYARGGDADETLVRFDDLRLQNPFHLKDFQSTFSAIDPALISDMHIYAGGFPVAYGDRMSGVIDIDPVAPIEPRQSELALSTFNASALTSGRTRDERGEWLLSIRRGNLDLIVDATNSDIGRPTYFDAYVHVGRALTDSVTVSANALVSDDAIVLHTSDREEQARAGYHDAYYWLRFDYQPTERILGNVLAAHSNLDSERSGRADQEGIATGEMLDLRAFTIHSLQSDWSARLHDKVLWQFGGEWRAVRGRYDYHDTAQFDLLVDTPGAATEVERERDIKVRPRGDHFGAYTHLRIDASRRLTIDGGLRWDRETLSRDASDQLSPRLGLLYQLGERTNLRASWGRYAQTQSIAELPVSDGVTEYAPSQRATHLIASVEHHFATDLDLRLELYRKDYQRIRPRYENLLNTFVLLPELKPDRIRVAPDRATAAGVELTLRGRMSPPLTWWLSYTHSKVTDDVDGERILRSWDQRHAASAGLVWRNDRWELSVAGRWHDGWPTTALTLASDEPVPIVTVGPRNRERLNGYRSVDVRMARTFRFRGAATLTVFLETNNVLNRRNECCVEFEIENEAEDEPGLEFSRRASLPLTPTLGAVWRF